MTNPDRIDLLWQLLANKHQPFCVSLRKRHSVPSILIKPEAMDQATTVNFERAEAYFNYLLLQNDDELTALLQRLEQQKLYVNEKQHPFNQPDALATDEVFEFWSRAEFWSIGESAALLNGRNPLIITEDRIEGDRSESKIAIKLKQAFELLERARHVGSLDHWNSPKNVINWLELKHLEMPQRLKDMALQRSGTSFTLGAENKRLKDRLAVLEAKPISIENESSAGKDEKPVGPRERDSLLKLILGMAIGAYRYDPKATKSSEINEIASDLRLAGLEMDDGTVRKYLNEGKALFSDKLNRTE